MRLLVGILGLILVAIVLWEAFETIILPRRNEVDLEDVPEEVRRELEFVLVDRADQVVEKALVQHRQAVSRTSDEKAA